MPGVKDTAELAERVARALENAKHSGTTAELVDAVEAVLVTFVDAESGGVDEYTPGTIAPA